MTPTVSVPATPNPSPAAEKPVTAPTAHTVTAKPAVAAGTAPTMAQQANRVVGAQIAPSVLKRLQAQKFNTRDVTNSWFHCLLYSETDAWKSTTAAKFGTPENTRIVLVRRKEQMIPLRSLGYSVFLAENWSQASTVLMYPEAIWPEWANLPDRTLIIDDVTELKDMAMEDNETGTRSDGSTYELQDVRQVIKGAKNDIRDVMKSVLRKPLHFIVVSMARAWDQTSKEGRIAPDLPQSISNLITTDFEFCFYINKKTKQLVTGETRITGTRKNDKGKDESYIQTVFAKHKLPLELEGKGILKPTEKLDLRSIWERIKAAGALSPEQLAKLTPVVAAPQTEDISDVGATESVAGDATTSPESEPAA